MSPDPPHPPRRFARLRLDALEGGLGLVEADTVRTRLLGVIGLGSLDPALGLRLRAGSIHTVGVRFALDLIWLDAHGRVLRVDRSVPPLRIRMCRGARTVVEVAAGSGDRFARALG